MNTRNAHDHDRPEEEPTDEEMQEPSTEKDIDDVPAAPPDDHSPSHEAVGIGVKKAEGRG